MVASCLLAVGCALFFSWVLGSHPWLFFLLSPFIFIPALSCARHWRRDPAGIAHVCEVFFPRGSRSLLSCTLALLYRRGHLVREASLLSAVARRTSATFDSCSRHCSLLTRHLVVSGHLSTSSALLIDRSAEPVESSPALLVADPGAAAHGHHTHNDLVSHTASILVVRPL